MKLWLWMLHMCVYMHSRFIENHPIRILEDGPLISEGVLSHSVCWPMFAITPRQLPCQLTKVTFPCHFSLPELKEEREESNRRRNRLRRCLRPSNLLPLSRLWWGRFSPSHYAGSATPACHPILRPAQTKPHVLVLWMLSEGRMEIPDEALPRALDLH
jgi:hypothetical protein